MGTNENRSTFSATVRRTAKPNGDAFWAFVVLPEAVSAELPRRGRVTVAVVLAEQRFQATLEPDGQLSHWLPLSRQLCEAARVTAGASVTLEIMTLPQEPEPEVPAEPARGTADRPGGAGGVAGDHHHRAPGLDSLDHFRQAAQDPRQAHRRCLRHARLRQEAGVLLRSLRLLQQGLLRTRSGGVSRRRAVWLAPG